MKKLPRSFVFSIIVLASFFGVLEAAGRLWEFVLPGGWSMATMSRLDGVIGTTESDTMFRSDAALAWKLKSSYSGRRFELATIHPLVVGDRAYQVATNSHGFRDDEFDLERARGRILVVCLGDSVTFGLNADQGRSYPARLQETLERLEPGRFRVWNAGVPGYTSLQGAMLLEQMPFPRAPDLVLLAYGHNDSAQYEAHFEQMRAMLGERGPLEGLRDALNHSAAYRGYKRLLVSTRDRMRAETRLPTSDGYRLMIRQAEQLGAGALLVAMNHLRPEVREAIRHVADEKGRRHVDFGELFRKNGGDALMSEVVHPNEAGYAFIAEVLAREILQLAATTSIPTSH